MIGKPSIHSFTPDLRMLSIYLTMNCNCRCKMCHIWGETGWAHKASSLKLAAELDMERFARTLADICREKSSFAVILSGGEPLLARNFLPVLELLREKHLPVILLTNGTQLKRYSDVLLSKVWLLQISLDGPPAVHNSIRGREHLFEEVCDGIEGLIALKRARGATRPIIQLNYTLSAYSAAYLKEFLAALRERFAASGITFSFEDNLGKFPMTSDNISIQFTPVMFTHRPDGEKYASEMKQLLNTEVSAAWQGLLADKEFTQGVSGIKKELERIYQEGACDFSSFIDIEEYFTNPDNLFGRTNCYAPWHELVIRPDGETYFCIDFPDYSLGNIYTQSFSEIWLGQRAVDFREKMMQGIFPVCKRCCRFFVNY